MKKSKFSDTQIEVSDLECAPASGVVPRIGGPRKFPSVSR